MSTYSLSHLSDSVLLRNLTSVVARERIAEADVLAHLAEVDARKLYLPAGFPSMYAYCPSRPYPRRGMCRISVNWFQNQFSNAGTGLQMTATRSAVSSHPLPNQWRLPPVNWFRNQFRRQPK